MGFKAGIVGLPNVGKSTLFNALTRTAAAQAANYPFCTIEPNVGDVAMPEPRLDVLAKIAGSKEIIPTRMNFVDIAGLVKGASKGEGLGNQFLATIREVDAVAYVLRCFEDDDITHVSGKIDPLADFEVVETELMLADMDSLEKRRLNVEKKAKGGDKEAIQTLELLKLALEQLEAGKPARRAKIAAEDQKAWKMLQLLTSKPVFYICNVDEDSAATGNKFSDAVVAHAKAEGSAAVVISAKIESETAVLVRRRAEGIPRKPRPRRARPQPRHPRRLRTARPADLLHRRPEGSARLDDQEGHDRPAGRRRHPRRLREGLHQGRNDRLRRLREVQRRKRRQGRRQGPPGRQGIRRPGRRRDALPVQRLIAGPQGSRSSFDGRSAWSLLRMSA